MGSTYRGAWAALPARVKLASAQTDESGWEGHREEQAKGGEAAPAVRRRGYLLGLRKRGPRCLRKAGEELSLQGGASRRSRRGADWRPARQGLGIHWEGRCT